MSRTALGPDQVEGTGLGRDHPGHVRTGHAAQNQRAKAVGVAGRDELVATRENQAVGPPHARERRGELVDQRALLATRHQLQDDLGVGVAREDAALGLELVAQALGVDQVAVVSDADRSIAQLGRERLDVLGQGAPGGRVAHVADRDPPRKAGQPGLIEDVGDVAHLADRVHRAAIDAHDTGRLLAAVLKGVQAQIGEVGRLLVIVDADYPAHVVSGS